MGCEPTLATPTNTGGGLLPYAFGMAWTGQFHT